MIQYLHPITDIPCSHQKAELVREGERMEREREREGEKGKEGGRKGEGEIRNRP